MKKWILFVLFLFSNLVYAQETSLSKLNLLVIELDKELKPISNKTFNLGKDFSADNGIISISFLNLDKEGFKLSLKCQEIMLNQKLQDYKSLLGFANQMKCANGSYYFIIDKEKS